MCAICRKEPCDVRCPNAPDPEPIMICAQCEEGIFYGDKYYDSQEGPICKECMESMRGMDLLEILGEELSTAEQEEHCGKG